MAIVPVYLFNKRVQPADIDEIKVHQCLIEVPIDMWDTLVCGVINAKEKPGYTKMTFGGQLMQARSQAFYDRATPECIEGILQLIDLKRFDDGIGKKVMTKVMVYFAEKYGYQILPMPKRVDHPFKIGDVLSFGAGKGGAKKSNTGVVLALINVNDFVVQYANGTTRVRRLGDQGGKIQLKRKAK